MVDFKLIIIVLLIALACWQYYAPEKSKSAIDTTIDKSKDTGLMLWDKVSNHQTVSLNVTNVTGVSNG